MEQNYNCMNAQWFSPLAAKTSGAPNDNFRKICVRKTNCDLEFSEHML